MPEDAEYILQRTQNVHGFYGASSMERYGTVLQSVLVWFIYLTRYAFPISVQSAYGSGDRGADAQVQGHQVLNESESYYAVITMSLQTANNFRFFFSCKWAYLSKEEKRLCHKKKLVLPQNDCLSQEKRIFRCRESNPGRMGENHKCYRLHHSGMSC
jgi:hypothetical protein